MRAFYVFLTFFAITIAAVRGNDLEQSCYEIVGQACSNAKLSQTTRCTAKYGNITQLEQPLDRFINQHFTTSFHYLLMSTHFANYNKNRPGFEKLFRGLSDDTWEDGIDLIKYLTKRGGEMNFNLISDYDEQKPNFELYEYYAIARALDTHKKLAMEAFSVHNRATHHFRDPEISSHLEHEYMHKHRDIIRDLTGYASDLSQLLDGPDSSLSLYLFDEYLQKK